VSAGTCCWSRLLSAPKAIAGALFAGSVTRILVLPDCRHTTTAMGNFKHRIARHRPLGTTTLGLGE